MPCPDCGTPLLVVDKYEKLLCPDCKNIGYVNPSELQTKIQKARSVLTDERIMGSLKDYSKDNIILYLIHQLNNTALELFETRGMQVNHFIDLGYLIRFIYQQSGFGEDELEPGDKLAPPVKEVFELKVTAPRRLNDLEDQSRYALEKPVQTGSEATFLSKHVYHDSEFQYCWRRCAKSLVGGKQDALNKFDELSQATRDFDRPDTRKTLEEFAKAFFEFIIGIAFISSNDEIADNTHGDPLPDPVDVMDLKELTDRFDSDLGEDAIHHINQDGTLAFLDKAKVDAIGEQVFDNWSTVRDAIIVSEDNPDAHPIFFEITYDKVVRDPPGREPVTIPQPSIVYARLYVQLIRMQLFPLITEGSTPVGHGILKGVCDSRGKAFEQNVYDRLQDRGYEPYHSAWYTKSDQREIDIILPRESTREIWFIECKYLLPELQMGTAAGIQNLNEKFNEKVFRGDGEIFPEKVDIWTETKPGSTFLVQSESNGRIEVQYCQEWEEYDTRKLVVSNIVPSYIEKHGVEFHTDMEFLDLLNGESPAYTHSR